MYYNTTKKLFIGLQIILWLIVFLIWLVYGGIKWRSYSYAFAVSLVSFSCYAILIYGNSFFLLPLFYKKEKRWKYFLILVLFFASVCLLRLFLEHRILFPIQGVFYNYGLPHISLVLTTNLIALLFGILLHVAKNYIGLLKVQEEMKTQQIATELNLLKQQVQPHFLFNTLNNIYSLANVKSDNTKVAIAKLAGIMRYFTEDAPKEKVPLQTEIDFINNYISLEQLRMLHPVKFVIHFSNEKILLPTMLLMPFIENLFKHGIDKTEENNEATVQLSIENNRLHYTVKNKLCTGMKNGSGFGLANLKKRLDLLYDNDYTMQAKENGAYFEASMEIPL
jgi:sensor histidine kinase YesM